jgi:hypothetical protein
MEGDNEEMEMTREMEIGRKMLRWGGGDREIKKSTEELKMGISMPI